MCFVIMYKLQKIEYISYVVELKKDILRVQITVDAIWACFLRNAASPNVEGVYIEYKWRGKFAAMGFALDLPRVRDQYRSLLDQLSEWCDGTLARSVWQQNLDWPIFDKRSRHRVQATGRAELLTPISDQTDPVVTSSLCHGVGDQRSFNFKFVWNLPLPYNGIIIIWVHSKLHVTGSKYSAELVWKGVRYSLNFNLEEGSSLCKIRTVMVWWICGGD